MSPNVGERHRPRRSSGPGRSRPEQSTPVSPRHLDALTQVLNSRVFGPDLFRLVARCRAATERVHPSGVVPTDRLPCYARDAQHRGIDLALLPAGLLERLLDAFGVRVDDHLDRGAIRITVRISSVLSVGSARVSGLTVQVPDGCLHLTPAAARALLKLMNTVAARRTAAVGSGSAE